MRAAHIFNVGKWVIGNDVFLFIGMSSEHSWMCAIHVGEAWELFSFKYQEEGKQLFPCRVPSESLKWSFRKVPLCD